MRPDPLFWMNLKHEMRWLRYKLQTRGVFWVLCELWGSK